MDTTKLLKGIPPQTLLLFFIFQSIVIIAAVLVALDARERGAKKEGSVLWAFMIMMFPPIVFIYLIFRTLRARLSLPGGWSNGPPGSRPNGLPNKTPDLSNLKRTPTPDQNCPYCGGALGAGDRLCKRCGKLL